MKAVYNMIYRLIMRLFVVNNLLRLKFLYNIFIKIYPAIAKLISFKNEKANFWVAGRNDIFEKLSTAFNDNNSKVIWMHCSSLGEFEQGRPIIEELKKRNEKLNVLITFFSPSGYEVRKNYAGADWVFYLPMDSQKNAFQFFDIVKPSLILFVKYEFWFYYLTEAKKRQIPLLLVSGIFRADQAFFKWYGSFYREMLGCFTHLFLQNQASAKILATIGFKENISISGDTRFDRVLTIANNFSAIATIENFIGNSKVIVAGSTWLEDDKELQHYAKNHPEIKFIIAPHDVQQSRIDECVGLYKNVVLFSKLAIGHRSLVIDKTTEPKVKNTALETGNQQPTTINILIVDNIGLLSQLYHYATICYVGGGFGDDGVHNVLEAAVYNKPVVFGPVYEKFIEATELLDNGGAFSVDNALELEQQLDNLLSEDIAYKKASNNAGNYVRSKIGATKQVIDFIYENRLLTN